MHFAKILLASALAAVASAVEFTNPSFGVIPVGQPFNVTWSGAVGAVTIKLKDGPVLQQQLVSTIASGLTGASGSFLWTPATSLPNGLYNLEIDDSTNVPNYSVQFTISGGTTSSSSSAGASSSTGSSTSAGSTSSATATASSTLFSNSTTTSRASSTSASRTGTATSSTASPSPSGNAAVQLGSPLALVMTAFLAFFYLN